MIAIIDFQAGNLQSLCNGLTRLGEKFEVIQSPAELQRFDKVIFPGDGAAGVAMEVLQETGFDEAIRNLKVPFLGICIGLQILADFSEEDDVPCLGIIPGRVKKIPGELKIPHMGWNTVTIIKDSPLTHGIPQGAYVYFIHSYYFDAPSENILATTEYSISLPVVIQKDNFYATQFHPEKSGDTGLTILKNFCSLC